MKSKFYRHLAFWATCTVQGTLLEYTWIESLFTKQPASYTILLAISFNLVLMPSKILFTYYAVDVAVTQPLKKSYNVSVSIIKLSVAFLLAIILYRIGCVYFINPIEYPLVHYSFRNVFEIGWMFVAFLDIGCVTGIATALTLFRLQTINIRNEKDLIKDKLETELKFLKNQINPHFLFNTLNDIYALSRKKSDKAPEVVMRLSKLLRFMLYESVKDVIPIAEEINILEDYVQLEKVKHSDRFNVFFHKEIDDYNQHIAPLILLPFIENAFKHGINETIDESSVEISVVLKNGQLTFLVKNTHDGQDGGTPVIEKIGLSNTRRQLELIYHDFSLTTRNVAQTFFVDLKINLNRNGKL
jgi:two-component system LytT family sensor kinase